FFGFEDFAGVDYVTYFFHVREDLAARGETDVFTPALDPFQDSETRGRELLGHIEGILEETGAARVNLIGHSQGGLDARVAASLRPDLVASVTTYATPNRSGAPVADVVLGLVDDRRFEALADALVRLIAAPLWDAAGNETSVFASLHQLSTPGIEALNAAHPDAEGVTYFSIAGRTDRDDGGTVCQAPGAPGFITRYARSLDPVDPLLDLAEQITDGGADDLTNDGLVRVDSAKWGRFLGCVPADHFDEVGQLLGDGPGFGNDFDHYELFAGLVAFLRERGF
ncbi:MAG: alpha/beta fold hydrolase, partial [Myxococcales bacterium]|nr:alpha/beta fold hydrolase [Myxococcales bacterium]